MDGLLIDSEPLWQEAAANIFFRYNITLTPQLYHTTTGLRTKEFTEHWFRHFKIAETQVPEAAERIVEEVIRLINSKGRPMPGVEHIISFFAGRGFKIGLATSSGRPVIESVLNILGIKDKLGAVVSAESLLHGKPHPEVYLNCAAELGALPYQCICFEDSFNGMIAVKAARMRCVVVPSAAEANLPVWHAADLKISSLQNFNELLMQTF